VSTVSSLASILLGAAFVVAGASKLAAGPAWPQQARALGAPAFTTPFVPWLELAVGASLVVQLVEPIPAVVAILLLVAFSALIAANLAAGRRPPCACFGAWTARPIGPLHLARNAALMVLGLLALYP
jgi:uncharacterized membrane protein YphA (DoxX/SURF4 family)